MELRSRHREWTEHLLQAETVADSDPIIQAEHSG
jgi:hypothetical protein